MAELRFSQTEVRAEGNKIVGYASVYFDGTPSTEYTLWRDAVERISPNAFNRAIQEKHDVRALLNHDPNYLLGRSTAGTLNLSTDSRGLKYEIQYDDTDPDHQKVRSKINRGDLNGSSFAFRILKESWSKEENRDVRTVEDVELLDVGPVVFPAYAGSTTGLRSDNDASEARDSYDRWVRNQATADRLEKLSKLTI